jgi:hypothetical protein
MAKFFKDNWIALTLVILTIASELIHLLFIRVPFNDNVKLDSPIYYLVNQFGGSTLIWAVFGFMLMPERKVASRLILAGLVLWNLKEMKDEVCYILKLNNDAIYTVSDNNIQINDSWMWMQIAFILTIVFSSFFGHKKYKS